MNYLMMQWGLALCLLSAAVAQAQTPVYFFYDPACMQQLVYEQTGTIDDLAHTDYCTNIANDKQVILRVQNDPANLNRTMMSELPVKPILCGERNYLQPAVMRDVNNNRRLAYLVVQMGQEYAVYNIHSIATLEANAQGIVYTDPTYGFNYTYGAKQSTDVLNKGKNKERTILFEQQTQTACLPTYHFKVLSRHIETPAKRLSFVNTIGLERLATAQGGVQLKTYNGIPTAELIARRCNVSPSTVFSADGAPAVTLPPAPQGLKDTIGMTLGEKRVWMARQKNRVVPTVVETTPLVVPPPATGVPLPNRNIPPNDGKGAVVQQANLLPGGIYIVQEQDNLYSISERFGVSVERLVEINGLKGFELGLNQPLKVVDDGSVPHQDRNPQIIIDNTAKTKTTVHLVEQGETLYTISKRYGIKLKDVYALNPSLTSDVIDINQAIVVGYQPL